MIINKKKGKNYSSDFPFQAKYNNLLKTVSFEEGYIFDCYNNLSANSGEVSGYFSQGSFFYKSDPSKIFEYDFNDWFYVDILGSIFKVSSDERASYDSMRARFADSFPNYLIWKAPSSNSSGGQQIISENIYLQDKSSGQKKGFSREILEIKPDGTKKMRINGSLVQVFSDMADFRMIESGPFERYVDGIDYELKEGGSGKDFAIKVELTAFSTTDDVEYTYLSGFSVDSIELIEILAGKDYSNEYPTLTSLTGIYYFGVSSPSLLNDGVGGAVIPFIIGWEDSRLIYANDILFYG